MKYLDIFWPNMDIIGKLIESGNGLSSGVLNTFLDNMDHFLYKWKIWPDVGKIRKTGGHLKQLIHWRIFTADLM